MHTVLAMMNTHMMAVMQQLMDTGNPGIAHMMTAMQQLMSSGMPGMG